MSKPYIPTPPFNTDEYLRQALQELARLDGLAYTGEVRRLLWLARASLNPTDPNDPRNRSVAPGEIAAND